MARQGISSHTQKLFYFALIFCFSNVSVTSLTEEGVSLLEFKASLIDPSNNLESWNSSDMTPCNWIGVECTNFKIVWKHSSWSKNLQVSYAANARTKPADRKSSY